MSESVADGCAALYSLIRVRQNRESACSAVRAMTGLQVAPTAPYVSAAPSSLGSAESFHKQVLVLALITRNGEVAI